MPDPIARYRALRSELERSAVSADSCKRMLAGLDLWEQGADLAESMGWVADPSRYQRNARHGRRLADRDATLRELSTLAAGSTWRRAQTLAGWLDRWSRGAALTDLPVNVPALVDAVGDPLSPRQIHRVLSGDRSA